MTPVPDAAEPTRTNAGGNAGSHSSSFPSIEEGRFPAGTTLAGRFRILGLLGKGGMGEVYRALDLTLNQPVALKFIAMDSRRDEAALARFRNEVRIARQVSHPNVCRVYDIGVIEGLNFLSMEYVDGEDLASLLRRIGRLPQDKALEFTRRICAGLSAAHERGVLHRDLKPANIMIDGRGQVRITDFGLAALSGDVHGHEIRSGTPAYMSPEQKAGKEVTVRSDIYSLGLVLHEMFTGKRPGESQATPTTLVKDLDPTIERVIQRCLDADPRVRPSSALNVAMALPGGDPVAAALAAGETPSPGMVAASGEKEGLQPRTAIARFVGVLVMLAAIVLLSNKTTLLGRAPLPLPPDALAFKAREMLKSFGYTEEPVDADYGFFPSAFGLHSQFFLRARDTNQQWERLASHQPPMTVFYYRQHQYFHQPLFLLSLNGTLIQSLVTTVDPPMTVQGMVRVILDANGRMVGLDAMPSATLPALPAGQPMDWGRMLSAAGLDVARLTTSPPTAFVPVHADSRVAWTGTYAQGPTDPIQIEAAALGGRPVFFRIVGPWEAATELVTPQGQRLANIFVEVLMVILLIAAALVAWRNVQAGRGDKRAAVRVTAVMFAAGIAGWALVASHVPTLWELYLLVNGLSFAAFLAGFVGLLYLAVEPFVRRHWPDALISWLRLAGGRFRDPLAASHILVGVATGLVFGLLNMAVNWATNFVPNPPVVPVDLSAARFLLGGLLGGVRITAFITVGYIMLLVMLRGMARRTWVGDVLFVGLMAAPSLTSPADFPLNVLFMTSIVWILRRFGLLAVAAMVFASGMLANVPVAAASWYAGLSLTTPILIAAVAAWALYVIVGSRPGTASQLASEPS